MAEKVALRSKHFLILSGNVQTSTGSVQGCFKFIIDIVPVDTDRLERINL